MTASIESRDESPKEQMAMALTGQKPTQRARYGECSEGLPGSKERGMCGEKRQESFAGSGQAWETLVAPGQRREAGRLRKRNGWCATDRENPETEVGRTLNGDERTQTGSGPGRLPRPKRRRDAEGCQGVRSAHSVRWAAH